MNAQTENPFITPEGHRGFLAKKLFDEMGDIHWGARLPTSRKTAAAPKTTIRTATTTSSSS